MPCLGTIQTHLFIDIYPRPIFVSAHFKYLSFCSISFFSHFVALLHDHERLQSLELPCISVFP